MFAALVWLAGRAERLEARAWEKTLGALEAQAGRLPRPLSDELRGALVCLRLRREAGLTDKKKGGAFLREARTSLADGVLDPGEASRLLGAARAACGSGEP